MFNLKLDSCLVAGIIHFLLVWGDLRKRHAGKRKGKSSSLHSNQWKVSANVTSNYDFTLNFSNPLLFPSCSYTAPHILMAGISVLQNCLSSKQKWFCLLETSACTGWNSVHSSRFVLILLFFHRIQEGLNQKVISDRCQSSISTPMCLHHLNILFYLKTVMKIF